MKDADDYDADDLEGGDDKKVPESIKAVKNVQQMLAVGFEAVAQQVQVLLQIIQGSADAIRVYKVSGLEDAPSNGPNDGGAIMSLDSLIINATDRLFRILQDDSAWDYKPAYEIYRLMSQAQKAQAAAFKEQAKAYEIQRESYGKATRPSVLYRPTPLVLSPDKIIVYYGPKEDPENWIAGIGRTLQEAMEDFDLQFSSTSKWQFYYRYNQDLFDGSQSQTATDENESIEQEVDTTTPTTTGQTRRRRKKRK